MHKLLYRQGLTLQAALAALPALAEETPEAAADVALMQDFCRPRPVALHAKPCLAP